MGFKLSQTRKDYYDTIRALSSYVSIVGAGLVLVGLLIKKETITEWFPNSPWIFTAIRYIGLLLGLVLIISPIVAPYIYEKINARILRKRKLSNIIIEKQEINIDITDFGKKASYYNKIQIHSIGKNNSDFTTKLEITGSIQTNSIYALNCFYKLENGNKLIVSYKNTTDKLNDYSPIINGQDKCLIYSAILNDTFLNKTENWDLFPIHYCIKSTLKITFPENEVLKWVKFLKVIDGKEVDDDTISPIVITENNRQKIILQIVNYDYAELLRLKWELV